ncbi:LAME_0F03972g1_1 [Lachancea meyersii CBS 8951]|uniref:LAME_0F03972g1_1 n=1 Tax=Lachancea meyersii CBS 8951 TaxID=1266667 RepID=A0A1G4JRM1_9SACH|nr:LAME_0F03972g1_1 [Lachancea meyersii CBS 8951]
MSSTFDKAQVGLDDAAGFLGVEPGFLEGIDQAVAAAIGAKAHEFRQLQAQNLESSVVVDEIKSASGQKLNACHMQVQELQQELQQLRAESRVLEDARSKLESQFQITQTSLETSQLQAQALLGQKEMLESSKNDLAKLLNEKIQDNSTHQQGTEKLLAEARQLRDKNLELEKLLRDSKSRELNDKAELHQLSQELQLSKSNNSWLENQLSEVNSKFNKHREKSHHQVSQLLQKSEASMAELQNSHELISTLREQNANLTQSIEVKLAELKKVTDDSNTDKAEFSREMALKQHLIDLLERQVSSFENDLELKDSAGITQSDTSTLIEELCQSKTQLAASELEVEKLQHTVQELLQTAGTEEKLNSDNSDANPVTNSFSIPKLYADLSMLKKQLIHEKRQKEHLQNQVESFVLELESKVPMLTSFKDRNEMLERELCETAYMLESISRDKEDLRSDLQRSQSQLRDYEGQIYKLTKQRTDLAHQIQFLLIQTSVKNDSNGPLTAEETAFVRKIVDSGNSSSDQDTQKIITQRLVVFQDIVELQSKNSELVATVRALADKLETEEREAKAKTECIENDVINEAKEAITTLQEHVQELESKIKIISKERDALKAVRPVSSPGRGSTSHVVPTDTGDIKRLAQLEDQLRIARREAETNVKMLNAELQELLRSRADSLVDVEKERSSRTLAEERLKMANESLTLIKQENKQMTSKLQKLQDTVVRQDAKTQETISDIIDCKSQIASLSSELKNSVATTELLRSSHEKEKRINDQLIAEKNELSILVAQLQSLQKEREKLMEVAETGFQSTLDNLNREISQLRAQLASKTQDFETYVTAAETKTKWHQERIESLNASLNETTTKLNLQIQTVQEFKTQKTLLEQKLTAPREKLPSYETFSDSKIDSGQAEGLRNEIEKMKINLKDAYSQVDEYKNINISTEECLSNVTNAFEQLKSTHSTEIAQMKAQEDSLRDEVSTLKTTLSKLATELEHDRAQLSARKDDFDTKLTAFKSSQQSVDALKEHYQSQVDKLANDVKEQTLFANEAHQKYEEELQRHADVSRNLSRVREESASCKNQLQDMIATNKELQKALDGREEAWTSRKQDYESQLDAVNRRVEDLLTQNRLLFDQIEVKFSGENTKNDTENIHSDSRELILSLRRECDICKAKLEVANGDKSMLQRKLQFAEDELLALKEEVNNHEAHASKLSMMAEEHDKILEQLNQLNLLRESNITLRNDLKSKSDRNEELENKVEVLQNASEPLENELSILRHSIAAKDKQITLMTEEINRWRQRSQDILHTYERVDPEEHKKMMDELSQIKKELALKTDQNVELEDRFQRLKKQARERLDVARSSQAALTGDVNALREEKQELEAALEREKEAIKALKETINSHEEEESIQQAAEGELQSLRNKLAESDSRIEELLKQPAENADDDALRSELAQLKERISELELLLENTQNEAKELENLKVSSSLEQSIEIERIKKELVSDSERLISEKEAEIKHSFEEMHAEQQRLFEERVKEASKQGASPDIDALKKEWEAEYEQKTLKRIEEANELLRKRIRLPTEEKINKIIESRKLELDREFDARVQQQAAELSSQNGKPADSDAAEISERHQQELEDMKAMIKKQMEEEMAVLKQKAFNEGQQKASMKSTLLERKIAKLEAQVKLNSAGTELSTPNTVADPIQSGRPSLITEKPPLEVSSEEDQKPSEQSERALVPIVTAPLVEPSVHNSEISEAQEAPLLPAEGSSKRPSEEAQTEENVSSKKNKTDPKSQSEMS